MSTLFVNIVQAASNQSTTINANNGTAGITMDTAGRMSFKNPAIVMAGIASGENQSFNTSVSKINFKSDTGNLFTQIDSASAFNDSTSEFTAPVTGIYHIIVSLYDSTASQGMNGILIYVGGARKHNLTHNKQFNSTASESIFGGSAFMKLAAGQVMDIRAHATGTTTLESNPYHTYLQIFYAGSE